MAGLMSVPHPGEPQMSLFEFVCREHRFALPLSCVRRVLPSAQPSPLPGAPQLVCGVLNIAGEPIAVLDFAHRLGASESPIRPSQRILLADLGEFPVGLLIDEALGVTVRDDAELRAMPQQVSQPGIVSSIVRLADGVCLIVDPDRFLFDSERVQLQDALRKAGHARH